MEIQRLVTGAKLGRNDDFAALVRLYQHRLLASVQAVVRERTLAEDLVQEAFVRAWSGLEGLRNAEAFPSWLWSIARNLARTQCRDRNRSAAFCVDADLELHPDPRPFAQPGEEPAPWENLAVLNPDQRLLVELRHGAGLSLRQIGAVLGVPEKTVKSRLFTLRRKLEKSLGTSVPRVPPPFLEEKIMDKIATLRLGAHVFERLSLNAQTEFARSVLADRPLPETVLTDVGRIDRGPEFLALYGVSMQLGELIGILNHVDRFTEFRLINHMEVLVPDEAERIKQNMFVFEDLVMFDSKALALLAATADLDFFAEALAGTEAKIRHRILEGFAPEVQDDLRRRLGKVDGSILLVRAAQEQVINGIKDLETAGRLALRRKGDLPDGELYLTAP